MLGNDGLAPFQSSLDHAVHVNERSKLTRFQRLILTHRLDGEAPRRAALI